MKKIKWTIMTLTIVFSICSAFATRPARQVGLYYLSGIQYLPAGTLGVNYLCMSSASVCTYTKSGSTYTPYQTLSTYSPIQGLTDKQAAKKTK